MEEYDDIDEDDQPRVAYVDVEREGRLARYAAPAGPARDGDPVGSGADGASGGRGSHSADGAAFEGGHPFRRGLSGAVPWASDDDSDGALPPTLPNDDDDDEHLLGASPRDDGPDAATTRDDDIVAESPPVPSAHVGVRRVARGGDASASAAAAAADADRYFLEEALGSSAAAAKLMASTTSRPPPRRSPRAATKKSTARTNVAATAAPPRAAARLNLSASTGAGSAALGRLAALTRDVSASAPDFRSASTRPRAVRPTPTPPTFQSTAARMKDGDDGPDSDVEDGIDDNSDEDSEAPAGAAIVGAAIAEEPAGAAIAVPAPASAPNPASDANPARKMMTAMSLLPAMHPGSPPGAGAGGFGDVARASSQRGRRGGGGAGAPVARLRRLLHRARARLAHFAEHRCAPGSNPIGGGWGAPLEVTLVGDAGVEANTRAWECETGEEDDAREGGVGGGGLGGDDAPWLRRGDAGAPRDVAVVFEARLAGELRLESGSRVKIFPPWHEVEVPASARTGFKRRRVVLAATATATPGGGDEGRG